MTGRASILVRAQAMRREWPATGVLAARGHRATRHGRLGARRFPAEAGRGTGLDPQRDARGEPGRNARGHARHRRTGGCGRREWIGTPASAGQLAYYSASSLRRERLHHRAEPLGLVCIVPGVAISVVLALFAGGFDVHLKHVLVSVMGILSVAAAVHEAYVHKKADRELVRQYRFIQRIFGSAKRLLDGTGDLEEKRRILVALGEAAPHRARRVDVDAPRAAFAAFARLRPDQRSGSVVRFTCPASFPAHPGG